MESSKNTNVAFSNKNYFQMELLFDLYKLISPQRKQERKINKKKNHSSQIQVDKLREEHMKNLEKLLAGVKPQYNI